MAGTAVIFKKRKEKKEIVQVLPFKAFDGVCQPVQLFVTLP